MAHLHGEVFIGGLRVRRADGKPHSEPLPEGFISQKVEGSPQVSWTLRDAREGETEATFPELEVNFFVSDGSMSQVKLGSHIRLPSKNYSLTLCVLF